MAKQTWNGSWKRALGVALWVFLACCTDAHLPRGGGSRPRGSTETGNPPVLDVNAIALVVSASSVRVRGEPGAVTPPAGEVEITVVATGARVTGAVNPDGSFEIELDASENDAFEVRVVHDGQRSEAVYVIRGGAAVGQGDGGALSCEQRREMGRSLLSQAEESADRSCASDVDCVAVTPSAICAPSCGEQSVVSAAGAAQIEAAAEALGEGLCANFAQCVRTTPCAPSGAPPLPVCRDGFCRDGRGLEDPCASCLEHTVSWRVVGPGILPALPSPTRFVANGCSRLATILMNGSQCPNTLPGCSESGASVQELNVALGNAQVLEAASAGLPVGEPAERSGFVYEISVDGQTFQFRTCAGQPGVACAEVPGLNALRSTLDAIADAFPCSQSQADCSSAFDPGTEGAARAVYWHDPASRACLHRVYRGSGGNANRYDTFEDCERACPPPTEQLACQSDRRFTADACLECGPLGGCGREGPRCEKLCASDADCVNEQPSEGTLTPYCGPGGLCGTLVCF